MKIYQIDSSARKVGSTSRALAKKLLEKIKKPEELVLPKLDFTPQPVNQSLKLPKLKKVGEKEKPLKLPKLKKIEA